MDKVEEQNPNELSIMDGSRKTFANRQRKCVKREQEGWKLRDMLEIKRYKGIFHAKMGTIKDTNDMDPTEAEDIKRWQKYTEEL